MGGSESSVIHPLAQKYRITSTFQDHLNRNPPSTAPGIDFATPSMTPVRALADGTIRGVKYRKFGGRSMWIFHGKGLRSYFAHLRCVCRLNGEKVKQGQLIGYTGNTGASTGPHLHAATMLNKEWVRPVYEAT